MNRFPLSSCLWILVVIGPHLCSSWIALKTSLSFKVIMWIIGSLAVIQAGIQLFMFMHMNEGEDGKTNVINIAYGILMAIVIVLGSVWVLTSGHAAHIH